jgi:hypothetical protein
MFMKKPTNMTEKMYTLAKKADTDFLYIRVLFFICAKVRIIFLLMLH